jgi:tRNA threonylcarbamoyl adenosine modification protein YeaZ
MPAWEFICSPKHLLVNIKNSINKGIMNFLSIDCSTDIGSLFVKAKNNTFNKFLQSDKSNNDLLMKQILDFFVNNNLKFEDVEKVFVNQGPGNFSGIRTSISIAKGISLSKNLSAEGYDTFIWSCAKFINISHSIFSIIKIREKYFIQGFSKNLNKFTKIAEITKEEIIKNYSSKFIIIAKKFITSFDKEILKLNNLNIVDLDHNQLELLKSKGLLNKGLIKPIYMN